MALSNFWHKDYFEVKALEQQQMAGDAFSEFYLPA